MLNLHAPTPDTWIAKVGGSLEELLLDHAHCEKKAAGVAMNLLFSYVDHPDLARAMTGIVREELEHFELVLERSRNAVGPGASCGRRRMENAFMG